MQFISITTNNTSTFSLSVMKENILQKRKLSFGFYRYFFDKHAQSLLQSLYQKQALNFSGILYFDLNVSSLREYYLQINALKHLILSQYRLLIYIKWKPWLYLPINGFIQRGMALLLFMCLIVMCLWFKFLVAQKQLNAAQDWLINQQHLQSNTWFSKQKFLKDELNRLQSWPILVYRTSLNKAQIRVWAKRTEKTSQLFLSKLEKSWQVKKFDNDTFRFDKKLIN